MSDDVISQVLIALARIEERIKAQTEQSEHRHNNLKMSIEGFVPRREIEQRFEALSAEIADLKGSRSKVIGWLAAAWLSGLSLLGSLILKKL